MKTYNLLFAILLLACTSCTKDSVVATPEFNVELQTLTVKAGTAVVFNFKGSLDMLSFYSGEIGRNYDFANANRKFESKMSLLFDSQILDGSQDNQFSVLVSSDFNGVYDLEHIHLANWTDLTSRFRLASHADNRVLVPSGEIQMNDVFALNKPVYLAFKYVTKPQTLNGRYNLWRVQNLLLQSEDEVNGKVSVMTQAAGAWKMIQSSNYDANRGSILTNNITFMGNGTNKDVETEAWVISKAVSVVTKIDLGPDRPVAIKSLSDPTLKSYSYIYEKQGTYTATFVGTNANLNETKREIKQITIVVNP
jgi:hypothetical protein